MTIAERHVVVPGLAMPFYPARPKVGTVLVDTTQALAQFCRDMDTGHYVLDPKLNGDRAGLGVIDIAGSVAIVVQNRHGGWLTQRVRNASLFLAMGAGSCVDGEVIDGHFYPFEVLAWGGASLVAAPAAARKQAAVVLCRDLDVPFLFSTPTTAFIRRLRGNLPRWEGYVKKLNSPYPVGHSATAETDRWYKCKW